MNKQVILFNKVSGEYFATVSYDNSEQIDTTFFTTKVIEFDDSTHVWDGGDIRTGEVVDINSIKPITTEAELDERCAESITNEYGTYHELNAIFAVLSEIIEKDNMSGEAVDKFKEIRDFINYRRQLNDRYKLAYQADPNFRYISKEEELETQERLLDGGLDEKINGVL